MNKNILTIQKGDHWIGKVYSVTGRWSIAQQGNELYFILENDFVTLAGPDLKLYLTRLQLSEIENRHDVQEEGFFIGELHSNKGAQRYKLPQGIDLKDYCSLVIHCRAYSVVWGGIELK